jgi:hypothetical protein
MAGSTTTKKIWPDSALVEVTLRADVKIPAPGALSAPDDALHRG